MKLLNSLNSYLHLQTLAISWVLRPLFFSTHTFPSSYPRTPDSLSARLSTVAHPHASVIPILQAWLHEGYPLTHSHLQRLIKQLRKRRRFVHALQVSEWMTEHRQSGYDESPVDLAVQLDLISKVHGLNRAEEYFESIPSDSRSFQVHGALLNCYARNKQLEKAESVMQKMRELGFARTTLAYNVMLSLYYRLQKYDKLGSLVEEMDQKGIACDLVSFTLRLNAYVATYKIDEMEKLLTEMEENPVLKMDWYAYVVAANGYMKAGLIDKTLKMLKNSERILNLRSGRHGYEVLLTLYAAAGSKHDVYRIWNLYKNIENSYNSGYQCMINSLMKLDDIVGAERIWEEWISKNTDPGIIIPNLMIGAYSSKGLWEKAEAILNMIIEHGIEPSPGTWDRLAMGYSKVGQMEKAVEAIKKAISTSKPGWKPTINTLVECLLYLNGQGEKEAAEELLEITRDHCCFPANLSDKLQKVINQENPTPIFLDRIEDDNESLNAGTPSTIEIEDKGSTEL